jgi:hypothetical protein
VTSRTSDFACATLVGKQHQAVMTAGLDVDAVELLRGNAAGRVGL